MSGRTIITVTTALVLIFGCADKEKDVQSNEEQTTQRYIRICSFNIAEIGNEARDKDHLAIARLIDGFDLIVIQEVQDRGGEAQIDSIYKKLNMLGTKPYESPLVISGAGRGFPGYEGYAFIYREPVDLDDRVTPIHGFRYPDHDIYGRIPAYVHFRAGKFDFIVAALHLAWGNKDRRESEVTDIKQWLIEFSNRPTSRERDLIVVGDVNRYGGYSQTALQQHTTAFDILVDESHLGSAYRLIFCEYLPGISTVSASTDEQSTTIADTRNLYDQIWISAGSFREFGMTEAVFNQNVGIIPFDMKEPWEDMSHEEIKSAISDHRPIWARFSIDLEDDDEPLLQ